MEKLIIFGRNVFAFSIIGLAVQQLFYGYFRPVFLPLWPLWLPGVAVATYLFSVLIIALSLSIILNKNARQAAVVMGTVFLAMFLHAHVLFHVASHTSSLGAWTNAFKILGLAGGAFIVAGSLPDQQTRKLLLLSKLIPLGKYFFALMLIVFGIDHFLYAQFVATLVPSWVGNNFFWTYFSGVALIGAGLALALRIKTALIAGLLGVMLFLWFIMLHIPRAVAFSDLNDGNELTSVFQALGFSGMAFVLSGCHSNFYFTTKDSQRTHESVVQH